MVNRMINITTALQRSGAWTAVRDRLPRAHSRAPMTDKEAEFFVDLANGDRISIELHGRIAGLRDVWAELEAQGSCTLFQSWYWVSTWCEYAAGRKGERPLIVLGRTVDGAALFVWPFAIVRKGGARLLTWLAQNHSAYNMGLYAPPALGMLGQRDIGPILDAVAKRLPGLDGALFTGQPAEWEGERNPFSTGATLSVSHLSYELLLDRPFADIYHQAYGKKSRNTLKRKYKKLTQAGECTIDHSRNCDESEHIVASFFAQKSEQLDRMGVENIFTDPAVREFHFGLCRTGRPTSNLECSYVRLDGEILATWIGISFKGRYYLLSGSHTNGEAARHSPGQLLMQELIRDQVERGAKFFDFGPGRGAHKEVWPIRSLFRFDSFYMFSIRGRAILAAVQAKSALEARIRRHPGLANAARKLVRRLRQFRNAPQ